MVDFNVGLKPSNDPNYMGASKEASRFDFNNSGKYEKLYSNLVNSLKVGVDNADAAVKGMIKSDVYEGVDKLRGAQGVDLAADNPLTPLNLDKASVAPTAGTGAAGGGATGEGSQASPMDANRPPNPSGVKGDLQRLQAAYTQGKISDTHYYAQLETMNRALRARYPGYRDEVDAMVQSVTGVTPANALRKAVLSDLNTAQSSADSLAKERLSFVKSNLAYLPGDFAQKEASGNPYPMTYLIDYASKQQISELQVKNYTAGLAAKAAAGNATSTDASQTATNIISTMNTQLMNKSSQNGVSIQGWLSQRIDELKNNKSLSPDQEAKMKAEFFQFKNAYQSALTEMWGQKLSPDSKLTLASALNDPGKQKSISEQAMAQFDLIEKALTDKDLGLLHAAENTLRSMNNSDARAINEKYPTVRALSAIAAMPGMSNVLQNVLTTQPGKYGEALNQLSQALTIHNITGGVHSPNGQTTISDDLKVWAATPGGNTPQGMQKFLQDRVNEVNNPALPMENKILAAKKIFGEENMKMIFKYRDADSQFKAFSMLTSPEVTKTMLAAKDKDPELWKSYSLWAQNSFAQSYRQLVNNLKGADSNVWLGVKWDSKAAQYTVVPTEDGLKKANQMPVGAGSVIRIIEGWRGSNIESSVDKVNQGIKQLEPILKANGFNPSEQIPQLTKFLANKDGQRTGFWASLVRASGTDDPAESISSFGGAPLNFTQPSGTDTGGRYSTEKNATDLVPGGADLKNLNGKTKAMLDGLVGAGVVEELETKSGYRDSTRNTRAGGAKYSKHLDGGAIDIDVSGYSNAEKTAVLEAAIQHGAKGIGIYPGGRSIHLDTRETPTTWGYSPFGAYRGIHWSNQPSWAHGPLKKMFGVKE